MKKTSFILCLFMLVSSVMISQTDEEKKKITASYNIEFIDQLKKRLKEESKLRQEKIENYLKLNVQHRRKFRNNGKSYLIYDVVKGIPVYLTNDNVNSAKSTNTDKLQTGGGLGLDLNGENMTVGMWEIDYPRATHDEFLDDQAVPQSRVTMVGNFFSTEDDHATHVGGTLIANGTNASAKGMAPKASMRAFSAAGDEGEATTEAANGLLVSNHSYGVPIFNGGSQQLDAAEIGAYTSDAHNWDDIAFNAPYYLAVMSAGNEGGSSGNYVGGLGVNFDKLTRNKTAKNTLVVASALPSLNPSGELVNFFQSNFSSPGPTDDFRVKPDIAGDGEGVTSSFSGADDAYGTIQGSSMASPNVAGSILLLQQYFNQLNSSFMRAATAKGLVCHTARDDGAKIGPDPDFGWGLLDAEKAVLTIKENSEGTAVIRELTLNNGQSYTYQFSVSSPGALSATICWTDPPGPIQVNDLNSSTPRLVNDLDLRLEDSGATVSMPWKLDNTDVSAAAIKGDNSVDNIERVDIGTSVTGNYTLTVSHKGTLTNGSQDFSLILTGANLTLSAPDNQIAKVSLWPNPADDKLNINFESQANKSKISLYDIQGREVYKKYIQTNSVNIEHSIGTEVFSPGIYFVNIQSGNAGYNKKIIIK